MISKVLSGGLAVALAGYLYEKVKNDNRVERNI